MAWIVFLLLQLSPPQLSPQSSEMWTYMVRQGQESITTIYTETSMGLVCEQKSQKEVVTKVETLADEAKTHPANMAEAMAVYLWNDWTLLYVEGYDTREVLSDLAEKARVEDFLEEFYLQHHACLLGILEVLTWGYEGYYGTQQGRYRLLASKSGEPYTPLALEPEHFPGTGLFEPLGLVYAVKLGDVLEIHWMRERAVTVIAETLQRRARTSDNPFKVRH
jgi:hypothetical protein